VKIKPARWMRYAIEQVALSVFLARVSQDMAHASGGFFLLMVVVFLCVISRMDNRS